MIGRVSFITILIALMAAAGGPEKAFALGESVLHIGAGAAWDAVQTRRGIAEAGEVRSHPVLLLSSARQGGEPALALSFDEGRADRFREATGNYEVQVPDGLGVAGPRWARAGNGAVSFSGQPLILVSQSPNALFVSDHRVDDFSMEFWLYPMNLERGERILEWTATRQSARMDHQFQRILCAVDRGRLRWDFKDFFTAPDDSRQLEVQVAGSPVMLRTWSHHLIRFDSATGLLEYLVDGQVAGTTYTTVSGREGGDVYTPLPGQGRALILGARFTGLMDEFRGYRSFVETPSLRKFAGEGRMETRPLDLGGSEARVLSVEARGGRTTNAGIQPENEYSRTGNFNFRDHSAVQFFIRGADNPYGWTADAPRWKTFVPGESLPEPEQRQGRYVQIAAVFYPSGDGEVSPYLEELRIIYRPEERPLPPALVTARGEDGKVRLSWRPSRSTDVAGYVVYYGTASGEYLGDDSLAVQKPSPIDVGTRTSFTLEGLTNGKLYYFAVAAYGPGGAGEFSRETAARPLPGLGE